MNDTTYNGWANYETWQAALWMSEADYIGDLLDQGLSEVTAEQVKDDTFVMFLEEETERGGLLGDIVSAWVRQVDWQEIAENYNETLKEG